MEATGDVARLDGLAPGEAVRALAACCASDRWARRVAAGRPYRTREALLAAAEAALAAMSWDDVLEALAAHPMIGQRAAGASTEAAWSRAEQAGVDGAGAPIAARLRELNRAYQERFGHVFLICAAGLPAEVMLRALEHRLRNDEAAEQRATRTELAAITRLRLERLTGAPATASIAPSAVASVAGAGS
jgi:2-oxo-4-hydroxy-4-carboxy-5-ureidoimidazoline decarboxylase